MSSNQILVLPEWLPVANRTCRLCLVLFSWFAARRFRREVTVRNFGTL
jgi:hypothetical protein